MFIVWSTAAHALLKIVLDTQTVPDRNLELTGHALTPAAAIPSVTQVCRPQELAEQQTTSGLEVATVTNGARAKGEVAH